MPYFEETGIVMVCIVGDICTEGVVMVGDDEGEGSGDWGDVAGVRMPSDDGGGDEGFTILSTVVFVATTNVLTGSPRLAMCFNVNALIGCNVATWLLGTWSTSPVCVVSVVMLAPLCNVTVWFFNPDPVL